MHSSPSPDSQHQQLHALRRALALLQEAASLFEQLEDFASAAQRRHLAALAADAAALPDQRDAEAAAWARLQALADSGGRLPAG